MAPAPPGNEFSDWLAPPFPVTSLPRAPPQPGAPAQSMAGGSKSAESLLRSGGSGICGQLESPRNAPSGCEAVRVLSRTGKKRKCSPLGSAFSCQYPSSTQFLCADFRSRSRLCQRVHCAVCPSVSLALSDSPTASRGSLPQFPAPPTSAAPSSGAEGFPSRRAVPSLAALDYISRRAERPAPWLRSDDRVA